MSRAPSESPAVRLLRALAAFSLVAGALGAGLAWRLDWFEQAALPKRLVFLTFGPLALAAECTAALLGRGKTRSAFPRGLRPILILGLLLFAWRILAAVYALSPTAALDPILDAAAVLAWLSVAGLAATRRSVRVMLGAAVVLGVLIASLVGLVQYAEANPGRWPFRGGPGEALLEVLRIAFEFLGLERLGQTAVPASLYGHANFGAEFVVSGLPLVLAIGLALAGRGGEGASGRRLLAVPCLLATGLGVLYVARASSRAALLALGLTALVFLVHAVASGWRHRPLLGSRRLHLAAAATLLLALGGAGAWAASRTDFEPRHGQVRTSLSQRIASAFDAGNTTVRERLDLWANSLAIAEDRPVFGVGPGGFARAYPAWADARRVHEAGRLSLRRQPEHPHHELVLILVEGGVPAAGLAAIATLLILGLAAAAFRDAVRRPFAAGLPVVGGVSSLLSLGLLASVSLPLQHAATTALGVLVLAGLAARGEARRIPLSRRTLALALAAALILLAGSAPRMRALAGASRDVAVASAARGAGGADVATRRTGALTELRHLDAALARTPDDHALRLARADALRRLGFSGEARTEYDRVLELHPNLINAWIGIADVEREAGRLESSRRAARQALDLMPRDPAARLAMARTDAASGFDQRAWRGFRSALAAEPEGPLRLAVLVELADAAAQRGDALAASFFAEQARYLGPDHPAVDLVTARIAQRFAPGSPAVAAAWQRVLDRDGANVEALIARGIAHLAAGEAVDALALLQTASRLDPRNPEILYQRARALAAGARYEEAHGLLIECARLTARPGGDMGLFDRAVRLAQTLQARLAGDEGGS